MPTEQELLDAIAAHPGIRFRDLLDLLSVDRPGMTRRLLNDMVAEGKLRVEGQGPPLQYWVVTNVTAADDIVGPPTLD